MADATPQRGGRARRIVRVTPKGVQAAKGFYDAVMREPRRVLGDEPNRERLMMITGVGWSLVEVASQRQLGPSGQCQIQR
jgi:hypothetical protein